VVREALAAAKPPRPEAECSGESSDDLGLGHVGHPGASDRGLFGALASASIVASGWYRVVVRV
jgi:hypothetical protein